MILRPSAACWLSRAALVIVPLALVVLLVVPVDLTVPFVAVEALDLTVLDLARVGVFLPAAEDAALIGRGIAGVVDRGNVGDVVRAAAFPIVL